MQLKKIFAIFLAATLIFSMFTVSVNAENVETLKVGVVAETATPISNSPQIFNQGDEVSYKISVDQNPGISTLIMWVCFDTDAFEYVGHSSTGLFEQAETFTVFDGIIQYRIDYTKFSTNQIGEAFVLNLKAKEGFCGNAVVSTQLRQNQPTNCFLVTSSDYNTKLVPFEGDETAVTIHNIVEEGVVTDPTCTEEGYTTYKCASCGDEEIVGNIISENGHTEDEVVVENRVEPDCVNEGSYDNVVYCTVCDEELSRETVVIDALGHRKENVIAKDPTCTEDGWTAYTECARCGETSVHSILPALGHTEGKAVVENRVEPDCVNAGSYDSVVYCTVCNEELSRETVTIDALGHRNENVIAKAPTCTEDGWTAYTECARCGETSFHSILPALGHTEGEAVEENRVEADCVNAGSYESVVYCTVCNEELSRETVTIDALGHRFENVIGKAPTCTEDGWTAYTECARCGETSFHSILPALGHTEGEAVEENRVEPDCVNAGSYESVVYCTVCNEELSRETITIDALGHRNENVIAKAPTCTEDGWTAYTECARCGETSFHSILPALGHTEGEAVVENRVEADCVNAGSYDSVVYCTVCNEELSRESVTIDALGHRNENVIAKAPTCTEGGWTAYTECARCGETSFHTVLPALGHTEGEAVEENRVEADCVNAGSYDSVVYCTVCNEELSRETITIDALGHRIENVIAKAPTCTEEGWTKHTECARCAEKFNYFVIAPLGHEYGDVTVVKPQFEVEGYSTHTCTVCGVEEKFDITPALTYVPGDVNKDGVVNNKDLGLLMQYLNNWEVEINPDAADVNGDDAVNNKDYGLLMQYLNNWEVELV